MAVGEHRAPIHRTQHLQVLLALVRVPHGVILPEHAAPEVTVLPDQVITAAGFFTQTFTEVGLGPRN